MRVFFLLTIFSLALWHFADAQSPKIDSLRKLLQASEGNERVDLLNAYAYVISSYDYLEAQKSIQEAYHLGSRLNYKKGIAEALLYEGIIETNIGQDSLAMIALRKSLRFSDEARETHLKGRTLVSLGLAYKNFDKLDSAIVFYQLAYEALKDSANPLYLSFLYLHLGELHRVQNSQSLQLKYLTKGWEIRKKLQDKHALVWAGVGLASYYTEQADYNRALSFLNEVQHALERDTIDSEEIAIINKERGIINANLGNHVAALDLFAKAKKYYERNPYVYDLVNLLSEIGYVLADISNYETSLKYYFKALALAEANHYEHQISQLYFRIGWVYYLLEQNKLSEEFCQKVLLRANAHPYPFEESSALNLLGLLADRNNKTKEALSYYNKSLALREKNNYRERAASTLLNIGILFEKIKDYKNAEAYDLRSLSIELEINHAYGICESYQSLGQLYTKVNGFKKAELYLSKGETLAKKIKTANILSNIYKSKRELYRKQLKYEEAYRYSILFENVKDSLFNQSLSNRIATMQYDFQVDQKDKEIKILGQQKELQQKTLEFQKAQIKQQRLIIGVGLFIFFNICVGTFIIFRFYTRVKKLNREISEQKEEIQAQAEELTESNDTISRINISLEEKVKARTSELKEAYNELDTFFYRSSHDFRRPLTTFMGLAEVAKITVKDNAALELFEKVNETARNLDKMLLKLQSISVAGSQELIYTEVLTKQIIEIELDNFRDEISQKSIQVFVEINLDRPFFSYPALVKFIVQNLVENAIAFCNVEAPVLRLKAYEAEGEVVLEVSDNGQGIDPVYIHRVFEMYFRANEKSRGNGLGLYIVKKMADKLNGSIEIKSELNQGTTVWVFLPNYFK